MRRNVNWRLGKSSSLAKEGLVDLRDAGQAGRLMRRPVRHQPMPPLEGAGGVDVKALGGLARAQASPHALGVLEQQARTSQPVERGTG